MNKRDDLKSRLEAYKIAPPRRTEEGAESEPPQKVEAPARAEPPRASPRPSTVSKGEGDGLSAHALKAKVRAQPPSQASVALSVRLPAGLHERLDGLAHGARKSKSEVIRIAVEALLDAVEG